MSLDLTGWVVTDLRGRFLAAEPGDDAWVTDPLQATVFREMWAAVERARGVAGLVLPWVTAVQVRALEDGAESVGIAAL